MIDNDHGSERFRVRGRAGSSEERRSRIWKSRWEYLGRVNWSQELESLRIRDRDQEVVDKD